MRNCISKKRVSKGPKRKIRVMKDLKSQEQPFSINIDDINSAELCCINLNPHVHPSFCDIEFIVSIVNNAESKNPQYNITYINVNEKAESDSIGSTEDQKQTHSIEIQDFEISEPCKIDGSPVHDVGNTELVKMLSGAQESNALIAAEGNFNKKRSPSNKITKSNVSDEQFISLKGNNEIIGISDIQEPVAGNQDGIAETQRSVHELTNVKEYVPVATRSEQGKNFAMMELENSVFNSQDLDFLTQILEFEKYFLNCALSLKIKTERTFVQDLLKAKELRQNKFISELLNTISKNVSDSTEFKQRVLKQLDSENEFIFRSLNEKISHENNLLLESFKKEMKDKREIVKNRGNEKCYQNLKRIITRYLSEKLKLQIKLIRQEVASNLTREREIVVNAISKR